METLVQVRAAVTALKGFTEFTETCFILLKDLKNNQHNNYNRDKFLKAETGCLFVLWFIKTSQCLLTTLSTDDLFVLRSEAVHSVLNQT